MIPLRHTRLRAKVVASLMFALALIAILALTWWAYHPGLSGDFLFDDFGSLPVLGATGPVDHWTTFWRYITSGSADPTGRPLTLLTFLIDAHDWPASPYPFKVTSVILHLINGTLLAVVLSKLGRVLARLPRRPAQYSNVVNPGVAAGQNPESIDSVPLPVAKSWIPDSARAASADGSGMTSEWLANDAGGGPGTTSDTLANAAGDGPGMAMDGWCCLLAALFGAGAWLLHPLLVSTTLYIVQREAMLPATFVLIAVLGWMAARKALAAGHVKRALVGMALSAWLCTALAVLSKANGALLPLLLLLIEWIALAPHQPMPTPQAEHWRKRATTVYLIVPSVVVVAYLLYMLPAAIHGAPAVRGWTVGQRLLTEPRVLTDYLRLLFVPHAHSSGLFNDSFPVSTSWLHPASTIPCILLILALIGAGFALRKRHPAIALALLFYFAAQLMESGWIPLELYFEHRNYLPAMLLFWPIGIGLTRRGTLRWLGVIAAACILLVLASFTVQRATLWGDGLRQARVWAAINPDSARAQTNAALYDLAHDSPRLAIARLRLSLPRHPNDIQASITLIGAECKLGAVQPQTLAAAETALAHTRVGGQTAFKWFNDALAIASARDCKGLDFAALQATLDAARRNPHWRDQRGQRQNLAHMQGELALAEDRPQEALANFNRALAVSPGPDTALEQAAYLGSHGYPKLGVAHLDYYATLPPGPKPGIGMPRIHAWVLHEQGWWPTETAYLRKTLEAAVAARAKSADRQPAVSTQ